MPAAHDHRGQRDEAVARRGIFVEGSRGADGEVGAAEPGEDAAEQHRLPADPVDLDADGVGGLGVLADRADAQAPPGLEQQNVTKATEAYIR